MGEEGATPTVGERIGRKIDGLDRNTNFNLHAFTVDFTYCKSGAEARKAALDILNGNATADNYKLRPGGPLGLMQFTQSMARTRAHTSDPNYRLRLNDVENLFDEQIVEAVPLNNMDLQGTVMTPHCIQNCDLSDSNGEGLQIKTKGQVYDLKTNERTVLKDAVIDARSVRLDMAPGMDARGIEIRASADYQPFVGSIEGAQIAGARLPADLSNIKGAACVDGGYNERNKHGYLLNGADGVFYMSKYGGRIQPVAEAFADMTRKATFTHGQEEQADMRRIVDNLSKGASKDWPQAAAARESIRGILADETYSSRVSSRLDGLTMPAESEIVPAAAEADSTIVRPAAFAAAPGTGK